MEKEQKKLLLVAVSVGVFLLVTVTVAILVLTPKTQAQDSAFFSSTPVVTPIQAGRIQPAENTGDSLTQPVINNTQETNIIIEGSPDGAIALDRNNGDSLTIQIPRPSTAAVPEASGGNGKDNTVASSTTARTQATATAAPAATAAKPASTNQPSAAQRSAATTQPAATTNRAASRPAAAAKSVNDYWVQTGAFSAMIRAEDAKELLASKGLTSIIENREIDGRIWYRVRLGPYTSENEANYWLALVKTIDGFGESQVRQTVRQQ